MPKIAHTVHSLNTGGAERLAADMALALSTEYETLVICLDEPGLWAQELRQQGISVHCLFRQPGLDLGLARSLARFVRTQGIDILHAHQCTPWFYAALSRLLAPGVKLVFEEHGRHHPEQKKWKRVWVNRLLIQPLTSRIIAVSEDLKSRLIKYEGLRQDRIQVIHNGTYGSSKLDQEQKARLRQELGLAEPGFVAGLVGRFDPIKNIPLFLQALSRVRGNGLQVQGLLVGDGPEMVQIKALLQKLDLQQQVVLTGYRQDASVLVQVMDLFVLPSFSEGTSMALLEAMAAGIPALVTDVGGNPEIVKHNQTGWLSPGDDLDSLSYYLQHAASGQADLQGMGQKARQRFEQSFSFQAMLSSYRQVYHELESGKVGR